MKRPIFLTVFEREMAGAFRDRNLTAHFILIPLLMYPLILWLGMTVALLVEAGSERLLLRIGTSPGLDPALEAALVSSDDSTLSFETTGVDPSADIAAGRLDAAVGPSAGEGCVITADFSRGRGRTASARLSSLISDFRERRLSSFRDSLGIGNRKWEVMIVSSVNEAGSREMGGFILGLIIPVTFAVMVSIGCYYSAIDATAGERERGTLETLVSTSAGRTGILTGKYLLVLVSGMISGLLNILSMFLCVSAILGPMLAGAGEEISFDPEPGAFLAALFASLILSALLAALMTASSSTARTYKEGQAMVMPTYILSILPAMFIQSPGLRLDAGTAAIPVLNAVLIMRESLSGEVGLLPCVISAASTALVCFAALRAAAILLSKEEALFPGEGRRKRRRLPGLISGRRRGADA